MAQRMLEALDNRIQKAHLVESLVGFIDNLGFDDLPAEAVECAKIFIMDTIAVGVAGTTYDATSKALTAARSWGEGNTRVIGRPDSKLARPSAAFANGMQIHSLEWDGLHEHSVVIALCAPLGAMVAELDRQSVSGKELILATVIAIEVAVFFGGDSKTGPRFFRPSTAGGMGAAAGMAILRGFSKNQIIHTLGLAYSQIAGTMQAHWEGSMALPMQIGHASRMAHLTVDMVEAGMTGPIDIIDGQFGYFSLFDSCGDVEQLISSLGAPYKITEMAHKPYPAGRATQAALTMLGRLQDQQDLRAEDIQQIDIYVPPLIMLLVGRPSSPDMTPSYARLCLRFILPLMLIDGNIDPRDFTAKVFQDLAIKRLGEKLNILDDGNPDRNALGPQRMEIVLKDGSTLHQSCANPLGSPANPLSKQQREDKVHRCFALGFASDNAAKFIQISNQLDELENARDLVDLVT